GKQRGKGKEVADQMEVEGEESGESNALLRMLVEVVAFGQQIQSDFGDVHSGKIRDALTEIYALLAYPDPYASPMANLLDPAGRDVVADVLNSAILEHQGQSRHSALERIYQQSAVLGRSLANVGSGAAGFVNLEREWAA
ncbi:hypothetical protein HK097_006881, partial [Rhizophlyctis rosea]